ncbi:hypothetical protein KM176_21845 [Pseudooceanicola sp. CBS1P-1]|uniref:Sugar transporter n=1 Tax=Pseudooceanicola albus TaxID=2692189 RepID=A0A6L7G8Y9_9RHOB|nr:MULTISPECIES: hypothetical protein [Pseudooceanicola]MBT9386518.1 hypothetical protein [Pseudooceanicola endophyticus]MXN20551.1 hypothetical protein [Pseudooceanicola albus]
MSTPRQIPRPAPAPAATVLPLQGQEPGQWRAQARRRRWVLLSALPCVVLPVLLAVWYFAFVAADRYAVEMKFSIRSPSGYAAADMLGMMTGMASAGATLLDSYMVEDYIDSGAALRALDRRMDLRTIYASPHADPLARIDPSASFEDFRRHFRWFRTVYLDTGSQVLTVEVQAFTPEEALAVAQGLLDLVSNLVNDISERARLDTMRAAEAEVARVEAALRQHRAELAQFRQTRQDIDPTASAGAQQGLLSQLEGQLARLRSERDTLLQFVRPDAPPIKIRDGQIAAVEQQLEAQKARLGSGEDDSAGDTYTDSVSAYEALSVDLEFLQRSYVSALAALEAARIEADRQQRYLATFVAPELPQEPLYPQRGLSILLVAVVALLGWALTVMAVYILREHAT